MKLICEKNSLLEAINIVQKAVSTKSTLPILEGILLEASNNLKLTGNDLEIGIECDINANILESGSIVLNSKIFGEIIRKLPNNEITIIVEDNNVHIESGNSQFNIIGIQPSEFPELPQVEKENIITISQKTLKDMIKQTIFAVGTDENRLILTGSLLEIKDNKFNIVSVDGYRLALREEIINNANNNLNFVVPGKTLNELSKILKDTEDNINIYTTNKHVLFEFDTCKVVSRLLEGEFLNYKQIIPEEFTLKVKASVKLLIESVERAALLISSNNKHPIKLNISMDKIVISCVTEMGKVQDSLCVETFGDDTEIGFNHRYFLEALKACECDEVYLKFNTSLSPCIITPVEETSFIYLVLPVRLRKDS